MWRRVILSITAFLIYVAILALSKTWRVSVSGAQWRQSVPPEGKPRLFAFFHGQMLPLLAARPLGHAAVLVSRSRDGDLAAAVLGQFGLKVIRGSTHDGAVGGLAQLLRAARDGGALIIAVDGSAGPRYEVHLGIGYLAARSNCEVVPMAAEGRPAMVLRTSWDHFRIPLPFARISASYGEPCRPAQPGRGEELRGFSQQLRSRLLAMAANP